LEDLILGIKNDDFPGNEFYLGGKVVNDLMDVDKKALEEKKVNMFTSAEKLLKTVSENAFKE
jgi:CRISPR-associated protein Cst2